MISSITDSTDTIVSSLKSVWGEDAEQWRPERFFEPLTNDNENKVNLGVFGNL